MEIKILWADDEIDLLKPHVLFLEAKGYTVVTATNGEDALELLESASADLVFLDENMPGLSGLETLTRIKNKYPTMPVVMITKSEEEQIMEDAIGSRISDYLIKPVNPKQILLSIKKNLDTKRLVSEKTTTSYQQKFREIGMRIGDRMDAQEWMDLYKEMVYWELQISGSEDDSMREIISMQSQEANQQFTKFVGQNYHDWIDGEEDAPLLSHQVFEKYVAPQCEKGKSTFLVVIDNLRYDQWRVLMPELSNVFHFEDESTYMSILPTATHYARNALFAGMMPRDIQRHFPKLWKNENDEGSKNNHEADFLSHQLKRLQLPLKMKYNKVLTLNYGRKVDEQFKDLMQNDLNVIVYNFVDMLSHARTEMDMIKELASDEKAYRSLTVSWFKNSPLYSMFKKMAEHDCKVILTTDHGTVRVRNAVKVVGDRNTNTNLRYKVGKNLNYKAKDVFAAGNPEDIGIPKTTVSESIIFAGEDDFLAYPNNYNHYAKYYRDTFQHGGISLPEMVVPLITLRPK